MLIAYDYRPPIAEFYRLKSNNQLLQYINILYLYECRNTTSLNGDRIMNIQKRPPQITKSHGMTIPSNCQCNYQDNYYGDQACIETKKKAGGQK